MKKIPITPLLFDVLLLVYLFWMTKIGIYTVDKVFYAIMYIGLTSRLDDLIEN